MRSSSHAYAGEALLHRPGSPLERVLQLAARMAVSASPVLIAGEDGSGREALAREVHARSARAEAPFVPLDCGVLPAPILDSELFGRVGGVHGPQRPGRIAAAAQGTLYLEEIESLHPGAQARLLRLIDEGRYEPVDGTAAQQAQVRLIVSTGADLPALVEAGLFRRDLFYALSAQSLAVPPLRERPQDVQGIFEALWRRAEPERAVAPEVLAALGAHPWPGNVRELENLVERLSVCTDAKVVTLASLPPGGLFRPYPVLRPLPAEAGPPPLELFGPGPEVAEGPIRFPVDLQAVLRATEERYLKAALEAARGSRKGAAELLGLHRTTLVEKLRRRQALAPHYEEKQA